MSILQNRLGTRVVQATSVRAVSAFFVFILSYLLLHHAGAARFGEYSIALVTVQLLGALSVSGMESLFLRLSIRASRSGRSTSRYLQEAFALVIVLSTIAATVMVLAGLLLRTNNLALSGVGQSLAIMSPGVLFIAISRLTSHAVRACGRDGLSQLIDGGIPSLMTASLLMAGLSLSVDLTDHVELIYTCFLAVGACIGLWSIRRPAGTLRYAWRLVRTGRFRFIKAAFPIQLGNTANYLADWTIIWLLTILASLPDVGAYRVISQFGFVFMLLSIGLEVPYSSAIANAHVSGDQTLVIKLLRHSRLILLGLGAPAILALCLAPGAFLGIFDLRSDEANLALVVLCIGHAFRLSSGASASALLALNGSRVLIRSSVAALAVSMIVALVGTPIYGLLGATVAASIGMIVRSQLNYRAVKSLIDRPFRSGPRR